MQRVACEQDHPCRYGGEEFVVILPSTDVEEAKSIGLAYNHAVLREGCPKIATLTFL